MFDRTSGKAIRSGKSVLNRSNPTNSAFRSGSSSAYTSGPPTASTTGRPAASGRMRIASSMVTFANSTCRITGCVRSQSMIVGRSIRPRTSSGTSGGTALTKMNRPGPARGGVTESRMTTSASPIPPWY